MTQTAGGEPSTLKGRQFASLTQRGQLAYADFIAEGASHDEAFRDARHSYGVRRGFDSRHQSSVEWPSKASNSTGGQ